QGAYQVADPRVQEALRVLAGQPWRGTYGVIPWEVAIGTITGQATVDTGAFAIADPRFPELPPVAIVENPKRSPFIIVAVPARTPRSKPKTKRVDVPVVIIAKDGTWHRPLTALELGALQDIPTVVDGAPLKLHGDSVGAWIERIGNAVPKGSARSIAVQM